jgi:hypothetical protein
VWKKKKVLKNLLVLHAQQATVLPAKIKLCKKTSLFFNKRETKPTF